jgi:hypothetical protein
MISWSLSAFNCIFTNQCQNPQETIKKQFIFKLSIIAIYKKTHTCIKMKTYKEHPICLKCLKNYFPSTIPSLLLSSPLIKLLIHTLNSSHS